MTERDEIQSVERTARELTATAQTIARERAECERVVASSREKLEAAQSELPLAERAAKSKRQAQTDAVRGRADLERRLHALIESEALARTRRQQAEQKAQGFRAAATFAASGRTEADGASDGDRAERERLVEARAAREASAAESRAAEHRAEEAKIGRLRAELELHVEAEREVEVAFAKERDDAEQRAVDLRATIESAAFELHEAEVQLQRLGVEAERIGLERSGLEEQLHDSSRRTREALEMRVAELRRVESDAARERIELEAQLAAIVTQEEHLANELLGVRNAESAALANAQSEVDRAASVNATLPSASVAPPVAPAPAPKPEVAPPKSIKTTVSALGAPPKPKAESFIRPATAAPYRPPVSKAGSAEDEELIPGLKSLMGNIFTRKKTEAPPEAVEPSEGSSIADRIARDFGLLGSAPDTPARDKG